MHLMNQVDLGQVAKPTETPIGDCDFPELLAHSYHEGYMVAEEAVFRQALERNFR